MTPRPYRPLQEFESAIQRRDLDLAIALARDIAHENGRPISLRSALGLLPLVAVERPGEFDGWALRWLTRWASERPGATIEQAAEIAGALADLPDEPDAALDFPAAL
jgi:hypothetical protein